MRMFSVGNISIAVIALALAVLISAFAFPEMGFAVGLFFFCVCIYARYDGYLHGRTEANGRPVIDVTVLANIVMTAMKLREASYDRDAAEAVDPGLISTNYNNYYTLTYEYFERAKVSNNTLRKVRILVDCLNFAAIRENSAHLSTVLKLKD